jgi:hypothetical protein
MFHCAVRGQRETKKLAPSSGGRHVDVRGDESGHGGGSDAGICRAEGVAARESSIPRKLYVFLADRMAGTSPEYIMCFPPLGLGY